MSLMTPARLHAMATLAADELRVAAEGWQARGRVGLHRGFRAVLCRAVCAWAGVPLDGRRARILTRQIGAMIDNAGVVGPAKWAARVRRWGAENRAHYIRDVTLGEDASRIRTRPGTMTRMRSIAFNVLRANGVKNVSLALYANAVSFDQPLALGT